MPLRNRLVRAEVRRTCVKMAKNLFKIWTKRPFWLKISAYLKLALPLDKAAIC